MISARRRTGLASTAAEARRPRRPLVIGHRGAAGYLPEHTLPSYELAARLGADYLEPDLVLTRDGVLVCRHEPEIGATTNVADHPEFGDRRTTKTVDGAAMTGWFVDDFTLAELKTLRSRERMPDLRPRNAAYDGSSSVPTFAELLELRSRLSRQLGRELGVYPEAKNPTYFSTAGLPPEPRLLETLRRYGLDRPAAPVYVQSFEVATLRELRRRGIQVPLVLLLANAGSPHDTVVRGSGPTYADLRSPAGLAWVAGFAAGIGPDKSLVIPQRLDGALGDPTSLVEDAHRAGLLVHPYTFRAENAFLPNDFQLGSPPAPAGYGRTVEEQITYLCTGLDGLFTDQPDVAVTARDRFLAAVPA